jgi:hypothetical protein
MLLLLESLCRYMGQSIHYDPREDYIQMAVAPSSTFERYGTEIQWGLEGHIKQ